MKGVFGGNFDPVHVGHLIIAVDALRELGLERVFMVPAWISPFKKEKETADFKHRLKMLELATLNNEYLEVLDIEGKRKGISYTYDTLKEIKKEEESLCLLIGQDQALEFESWYRWKEIKNMVDVYVLRREKNSSEIPDYLCPLNNRIIEVSSTEIRNLLEKDKPVDYLIPDRVKRYIKEHNLY